MKMKMILINLLILLIFLFLVFKAIEARADEVKDTYIDTEYQNICYEIGEIYGICPEVLMAIIEVESSGNIDAKNGNCYGLTQINGEVWGYEYTTAYEQIEKCAEILLSYSEDCEEISHALSRYNGVKNASELCEQGKMSKYAKKVLERSAVLERLHESL